jgi:hypothetical protein
MINFYINSKQIPCYLIKLPIQTKDPNKIHPHSHQDDSKKEEDKEEPVFNSTFLQNTHTHTHTQWKSTINPVDLF